MRRREPPRQGTPATAPAEPAAGQPTPLSPRADTHWLRWQVYAFVGAALLFAPIYGVMKAYQTYVDLPACERTCQARGYQFESLITGKNRYDCNCRGPNGRQTFHTRANVGGGTSVFAAIFNWVVRGASALAAVGVSVAIMVKLVRLTEKSSRGTAVEAEPPVVAKGSRRDRRSNRRRLR